MTIITDNAASPAKKIKQAIKGGGIEQIKDSMRLIWEILKSNMGVIRVILNPALAQSCLVTVKAGQKTAAGLVTHANFITLTPGTVSIEVDEEKNEILVHGITADFAESCLDETMDKKVSFLEGVQ